jgi:hypothetical protein
MPTTSNIPAKPQNTTGVSCPVVELLIQRFGREPRACRDCSLRDTAACGGEDYCVHAQDDD